MKFTRLNNNAVRCILTEQDMIDNGVQIEDFFKNREKIHGFLENIVEQAKEEVGYEAKGGMLAMQVMPLPNKGMAITFSENAEDGFNNMIDQIKEMAEEAVEGEIDSEQEVEYDKKIKKMSGRIFMFHTLDEIEKFAKSVEVEKVAKSSVYKDENADCYYLIIKKGKMKKKLYEVICFKALDYSIFVSDDPAEIANIQEHGRAIIKKNAIGILKNI